MPARAGRQSGDAPVRHLGRVGFEQEHVIFISFLIIGGVMEGLGCAGATHGIAETPPSTPKKFLCF